MSLFIVWNGCGKPSSALFESRTFFDFIFRRHESDQTPWNDGHPLAIIKTFKNISCGYNSSGVRTPDSGTASEAASLVHRDQASLTCCPQANLHRQTLTSSAVLGEGHKNRTPPPKLPSSLWVSRSTPWSKKHVVLLALFNSFLERNRRTPQNLPK